MTKKTKFEAVVRLVDRRGAPVEAGALITEEDLRVPAEVALAQGVIRPAVVKKTAAKAAAGKKE